MSEALTNVESSPSLLVAPDEEANPGAEGGHIQALDGVRGLAILAVLLDHVFNNDIRNVRVIDVLYRVFAAGWIGVDLFFVLSGFLITGILLRAKSRPNYFRNFYARRVLRIFPLYFGVLFLAWLVSHLGVTKGNDLRGGFTHNQIWLWTYLTNFRIARVGVIPFQVGPFAFPHFWSLAVEEQFYLVWPLIVLIYPRERLPWLCGGGAVVCLVGRVVYLRTTGNPVPLYFATQFRLDGLLLGSACAVLIGRPAFDFAVRGWATPVLIVFTICVLVMYPLTGWQLTNGWVATFGYTLLAVGWSVLTVGVCVVGACPCQRFFKTRVLRSLGRYSYGIYSTHVVILTSMTGVLARPIHAVIHSNTLSDFIEKTATMGVAIAVGVVVYHLYERPFLRLKRFFPSPTAVEPLEAGARLSLDPVAAV